MGRKRMDEHEKADVVICCANVPASTAERLRTAARVNDRSISGQIRHILRDWVLQQGDAAARTR